MKQTPTQKIKHYDAIHLWLKYHYGKADHCVNPECPKKSKNYQWALKKGKTYEKNRDNFFQLCCSCHSKYDFTEEQREHLRAIKKGKKLHPNAYKALSKKLKGVPRTEEVKRKIGEANKRLHTKLYKKVYQYSLRGRLLNTYPSVKEASEKTGIYLGNISLNCLGIQKTSHGYIFSYKPLISKIREEI